MQKPIKKVSFASVPEEYRVLLARYGNDTALDTLYEDPSENVRYEVARRGRPQYSRYLLHDDAPLVRRGVAEGYGSAELDVLVNDPDPDVRKAVALRGRDQDLAVLFHDPISWVATAARTADDINHGIISRDVLRVGLESGISLADLLEISYAKNGTIFFKTSNDDVYSSEPRMDRVVYISSLFQNGRNMMQSKADPFDIENILDRSYTLNDLYTATYQNMYAVYDLLDLAEGGPLEEEIDHLLHFYEESSPNLDPYQDQFLDDYNKDRMAKHKANEAVRSM